jgi:hypothetical protein
MYPKPKTLVASPSLSRRDFLRLAGFMTASLVVSSCQPKPNKVANPPANTSKTPVAISRVQTYDRTTIEKQLSILIDQLGGLGDVVKPADGCVF